MSRLMEGKAGLVTGAGTGIGRASALAFAQEGAKVMVSDINEVTGNETVRLINEAGGQALFFKCDVSDEDQVKELVDATVSAFGQLDWAHNNAGIGSKTKLIADSDTADWDRTLKVNIYGIYYALKYEIAAMLKLGGGAIVNTSSGAGLTGLPGMAPYSVSKWGINGITKTAALEYGKQGIRVNSICPSMTLTPLVEDWFKNSPEQADAIRKSIPIGRVATTSEQANAAVWLCSEQASFITGVNLPVDGGRLAK
jgi:NAD(P)-dependent dehydrogenase (short-subunit alcohol dehydrogenase family)